MTITQSDKTSIFENSFIRTAIWIAVFIALALATYYAPEDSGKFSLGLRIFSGTITVLVAATGLMIFWSSLPRIAPREISHRLTTAIRFCVEVSLEEYNESARAQGYGRSGSGKAFLVDVNSKFDLIPNEISMYLESRGYESLKPEEPSDHDVPERVCVFAYRKRAVTLEFTFKRLPCLKNPDLAVCLVQMRRDFF